MIVFSASELVSELDGILRAGKAFLAPEAEGRIRQAQYALRRNATKRSQNAVDWEVSEARPIETRTSEGEHQQGGKGAQRLSASISWRWELKTIKAGEVEVAGLASTRVAFRVHEGDESGVAAEFCFDILHKDGFGPRCHVQVKRVGESEMTFSNSELDIPRLASVALTPAECIELALAELFQERWAQALQSMRTECVGSWRDQRNRLIAFFNSAAARLKEREGSAQFVYKEWWPSGRDFAHAARPR